MLVRAEEKSKYWVVMGRQHPDVPTADDDEIEDSNVIASHRLCEGFSLVPEGGDLDSWRKVLAENPELLVIAAEPAARKANDAERASSFVVADNDSAARQNCRGVVAVTAADEVEAGKCHHIRIRRVGFNRRQYLRHYAVGALECRAVRQNNRRDVITLIFIRHQTAGRDTP